MARERENPEIQTIATAFMFMLRIGKYTNFSVIPKISIRFAIISLVVKEIRVGLPQIEIICFCAIDVGKKFVKTVFSYDRIYKNRLREVCFHAIILQ